MRSLRHKLVLFILPLAVIPLAAICTFAYYQAKEQITQDRTVLYLEQVAQGIADNIRLSILEKKEETVSMTLYRELGDYLARRVDPPTLLLEPTGGGARGLRSAGAVRPGGAGALHQQHRPERGGGESGSGTARAIAGTEPALPTPGTAVGWRRSGKVVSATWTGTRLR